MPNVSDNITQIFLLTGREAARSRVPGWARFAASPGFVTSLPSSLRTARFRLIRSSLSHVLEFQTRFWFPQNDAGPGLSPRSRVWQRAARDGSTSVCRCRPAAAPRPPSWETAEVRKRPPRVLDANYTQTILVRVVPERYGLK